jgi:hypothetical protein
MYVDLDQHSECESGFRIQKIKEASMADQKRYLENF